MKRWHGWATIILALQTTIVASELLAATPGARHLSPGEVLMTQISIANSHACAIAVDGAPYCWGSGDAGRLGGGNLDDVYLDPHSSELTKTELS